MSHNGDMDEYIIGAGAMLTSGERASITPAAFHAQVDPHLASAAQAVAVDFEGTAGSALGRLLLVAQGWNSKQFQAGVTAPLLSRGACTLADVFAILARATGCSEVHLFAHWLPDDETCATLGRNGVTLVVHSLEAIQSAALIADRRHVRWPAARTAA
jgi:hypothetical protein